MSEPKPLSAPHDAVTVEITSNGWYVHVTYTAQTVEALHAAGCMDDANFAHYMAKPRKHRGPGYSNSKLYRRKIGGTRAIFEQHFCSVGGDRDDEWKGLPGLADFQLPPRDMTVAPFWETQPEMTESKKELSRTGGGMVAHNKAIGRY